MPSLWFVVPAHGRVELTRICLGQLRNTCDQLAGFGIEASAVVIADDVNLDTAAAFGFWGYEQDNGFLGRKFNDGYELAAREGVDYVVPLGSDDWIHPLLIAGTELSPDRVRCARRLVMVHESGAAFMRMSIPYDGGIGMRIIPTALMQPLDFRPADEDRPRGVDTNTLMRLTRAHPKRELLAYFDTELDWQIVDFKSPGSNLNTFEMCRAYAVDAPEGDPWNELAQHYPIEGVLEMKALYEGRVGELDV